MRTHLSEHKQFLQEVCVHLYEVLLLDLRWIVQKKKILQFVLIIRLIISEGLCHHIDWREGARTAVLIENDDEFCY